MDSENKKITLRDYLIDKSIDVEDCARETKISVSAIYRVWNGNAKPGYKHKKKLEAYTGGLVTW